MNIYTRSCAKGFISLGLIIVLIIAAAVIGGGAYYAGKQSPTEQPYTPPEESSTTPGTLPGQAAENPSQSGTGQPASVASCEAFIHLKRGDTDVSTNGEVSKLQAFLGISPATGSYGALTSIGYTNKCVGGNAAPASVAGMSTYTDAAFGFSFWYPGRWKVSVGAASNPSWIGGGTITKVINISADTPFLSFSIEEFNSLTGRLEYPGGACGYCMPVTWYFDANQGIWMHQYPMGAGGMPDATQVVFDQTKGATPADVSHNTMGGLHIFPSEQKENVSITPLSAEHFLVIIHNEGYENPGTHKESPLVDTIAATDPTVAIPVSTAEQIATIQAEQQAYAQ